MHFLLINQFFAPDPAPTGQLLAHVARAIASEGHRVTVVCGSTGYTLEHSGDTELPGVEAHRLRCASFGHRHPARLASYASFYAGALRHALFGPRPDVILTLTTPPLLSLAGTLAKAFRRSRHCNWEMDVYPDVAVALGVFGERSLLDRAIGLLADFSRRRADANIVLGPCMRDRLLDRGIPRERIAVAENWVDGSLVAPQPFPETGRLEMLYSGNFGLPHDVETIAGAMARLSDASRFHFTFAGGGARRAELERRCSTGKIQNVTFAPYRSEDQLSEHLGNCHIGLVTQNPNTCGTLVPSKTYAFLAAARPFLFVGPCEAMPARIAERYRCGWRIQPGDIDTLTSFLEFFATRPDMLRAAGARGREAFLKSYHRDAGVSRILGILAPPCPDTAIVIPQNQPAITV